MSELIKKSSQKNINIYKFIWNSIRGNRISFFIFAFLEFANDIIGIFIAQYFNKKMVGYLSIESPILTTALFYVLTYASLTNITFITKSIILDQNLKPLITQEKM